MAGLIKPRRREGQVARQAASLLLLLTGFILFPGFCRGADPAFSATKSAPLHLDFHQPDTLRPGEIQILPDSSYFDWLETLIKTARHRIDLAMYLFKRSENPKNRPARLIAALIEAKKRGVAVRVILEDSGRAESLDQANRETARALRKGGVKVFFDAPDRTSHVKLVVVDRRYCLVGSHNLTESALRYNREFSLLVDSPQLAGEIITYLDRILADLR